MQIKSSSNIFQIFIKSLKLNTLIITTKMSSFYITTRISISYFLCLQHSCLDFFSRIVIMIKTTAKKKQNKKIPVQEICLLKRILISPLASVDFYQIFFGCSLVKSWLSYSSSFHLYRKASWKFRKIFYAKKSCDLFYSKMLLWMLCMNG